MGCAKEIYVPDFPQMEFASKCLLDMGYQEIINTFDSQQTAYQSYQEQIDVLNVRASPEICPCRQQLEASPCALTMMQIVWSTT